MIKIAISILIIFSFCNGVFGKLLEESNLKYSGSFRVPKGDLGEGTLLGAYGLAYNINNNSLIIGTHPVLDRKVVEISIPTIVNSADILELQTATVIQTPLDITEGHWDDLNDGDWPVSGRPGDFLVYGNHIIGSAWVYYDASGQTGDKSHFISSLDWHDEGANFRGMYAVGINPRGDYLANGGFVGGYMCSVPEEYQSILGGDILTGQCCIPIIGRTSLGPCVWVFNGKDLGNKFPVPAKMLLGYTIEHPTLGRYEDEMHKHFNRACGVTGVVLPKGFRSVVFFGNIGVGQTGNGDSCYGEVTHTQSEHNTFPNEIVVYAQDSMEIVNGDIVFHIDVGLSLPDPCYFIAKPVANLNYHMLGEVSSYDSSTGELNLYSDTDGSLGKGTGVYDSWEIHLSPEHVRRCFSLSQGLSEKGGSAYPYVYRIWLYALDDLLKVKNGEINPETGSSYKPWDIVPYDSINIDFPFEAEEKEIRGVAYDLNSQRIFILQAGADCLDSGCYPIVNVFRILDFDINQDGSVDINDVQLVVNVILGKVENSRADVNGDGSVTISDTQEVVNSIIGW